MKLSDLFGNNIYATEVYYGFSSATFVGASTEANRRDPNNAGHIVITSSPCLFLGAASNSGESTTQPSVLYIHSGTAVKGTFRSTDTAFSSVAPIECLNGLKFSMFNTVGPVGNHCLFYKLL